MHVHDAIATRRSARAFLPDPVAEDTLRRVLERAARLCSLERLMDPPQRADLRVYETVRFHGF